MLPSDFHETLKIVWRPNVRGVLERRNTAVQELAPVWTEPGPCMHSPSAQWRDAVRVHTRSNTSVMRIWVPPAT